MHSIFPLAGSTKSNADQKSRNFNGDIGSWNTSNVNHMGAMFMNASSFNQDISNWDVSGVGEAAATFVNATSFNQDLSSWDVGNIYYCESFSENTPQWTLPKPNFTNCTQ